MSLHNFNFRRLPAKQDLRVSDDDRALIEAALAAGKLKRIAQGVSGLPSMIFDPKINKIVIQEPEKRAAEKAKTFRSGADLMNSKRRDERRQRQEEAVRLHAAGKTRAQIAAIIDVHERTVTKLLARVHNNTAEAVK